MWFHDRMWHEHENGELKFSETSARANFSIITPPTPLNFFGLKVLPLDQLRNAFAQLFLDNEHIFWCIFSDVSIDEVIILIKKKWSLKSNFRFFE